MPSNNSESTKSAQDALGSILIIGKRLRDMHFAHNRIQTEIKMFNGFNFLRKCFGKQHLQMQRQRSRRLRGNKWFKEIKRDQAAKKKWKLRAHFWDGVIFLLQQLQRCHSFLPQWHCNETFRECGLEDKRKIRATIMVTLPAGELLGNCEADITKV